MKITSHWVALQLSSMRWAHLSESIVIIVGRRRSVILESFEFLAVEVVERLNDATPGGVSLALLARVLRLVYAVQALLLVAFSRLACELARSALLVSDYRIGD